MRITIGARPIPRAWHEEFDGIKPIRPIAYRKPPVPALKEVRRLEREEK
jgi:hypothetical protein